MMLTLEALPAKKGDCLLLHFGTPDDPRLVLIDGGPASVYANALRPRLEGLRAGGGPLPIDLLMISHIDDDHIRGILDLTTELIDTQGAIAPLVTVDRLWHNSFDDIIGNKPQFPDSGLLASLSTGQAPEPDPDEEPDDPVAAHAFHHALEVLASERQGRDLRIAAERLNWEVNVPMGGLVMAGDGAPSVDMLDDALSFHIIGPMKPELERLQKIHDDFLRKKGLGQATPEDALAAYTDSSIANLSSIVVLAKTATRSLLLTGDARGDKVLEGLELQGHLAPGGTMHVDLLKLMHHGSDRNVEPDFFTRVTADHYVFCGDGFHGNPERATLEMLFGARPAGGYTLHFTAELEPIDVERKKDYEKLRARNAARRNPKPDPGPWDPARHGVGPFLEDRRAAGVPFEIRTPGALGRIEIALD